MVRRLRTRRRRRFALQLAGGAALGLLLGVLFVEFRSRSGDSPQDRKIAGVTCSEVRENMDDFVQGRLPKELRAKIAAHLEQCPECEELVREKRSGAQRRSGRRSTIGRKESTTSPRYLAATD